MGKDTVTLFVCVTPSYQHFLDNKVNAVSTCKVQTHYPFELSVLAFDDGTPVWEMYQRCLDICVTPYYAIIGADDFIGPAYVEDSMSGMREGVAAASTKSWLISSEVEENEQIGVYDGWVAGVWNAEIARDCGGYRKPEHGGAHGCAALLAERACRAGFRCALANSRQYYYRIWSGSVSKPDPAIEERIRKRKPNEYLRLV